MLEDTLIKVPNTSKHINPVLLFLIFLNYEGSSLSMNLAYLFCRVVDDEGTTNGAVDELGSIAPSG